MMGCDAGHVTHKMTCRTRDHHIHVQHSKEPDRTRQHAKTQLYRNQQQAVMVSEMHSPFSRMFCRYCPSEQFQRSYLNWCWHSNTDSRVALMRVSGMPFPLRHIRCWRRCSLRSLHSSLGDTGAWLLAIFSMPMTLSCASQLSVGMGSLAVSLRQQPLLHHSFIPAHASCARKTKTNKKKI